MITALVALAALAQEGGLQWGPIRKGDPFALEWEFEETCEVGSGNATTKVRDVRAVSALLTAAEDIGVADPKNRARRLLVTGALNVELRSVRWTRTTDEYEVQVTLENGEIHASQTITSFEDFEALADACGRPATQAEYATFERAARIRAKDEIAWMKKSIAARAKLKIGTYSPAGPFRIGGDGLLQRGPLPLLAWAYVHDEVPSPDTDSWKARLSHLEAGYGVSSADLDDPQVELTATASREEITVSGGNSWRFDREQVVNKSELDVFGVALGALTAGMSWIVLPPFKETGETDTLRRSGTHEVSKEFSFSRKGHLSSSRHSINTDAVWSWEKSEKETKFRYSMTQSLSIQPEK